MQNRFEKSNTQKGFTLIEALVTLIIIGIISAAAIPAMSGMIKNQAVSSTSNEILNILQSARSEAIKRSTNVRVCFRANTTEGTCRNFYNDPVNNYIHAFIDEDNDETNDSTEIELFSSNKLNEEITLVRATSGTVSINKSILFTSKGNAIIDNTRRSRGFIGICDSRENNDYGRVIQVSNTGRAQVTKITTASTVDCS